MTTVKMDPSMYKGQFGIELTNQEMRDLLKCSKTRLIKNAQDYRAEAWKMKNELGNLQAQTHQMIYNQNKLNAEVENLKKENRKLTHKNQQMKNVVKSLAGCL